MDFKLNRTLIQLIGDYGEVVIPEAILVEATGLCAIYDLHDQSFKHVCTDRIEINTILDTQYLRMKPIEENDLRYCTKCGISMQEGFYFESTGAQYCSQDCLTKVISWNEYLAIYNDGN